MRNVLEIEKLTKTYTLGSIGQSSFANELRGFFSKKTKDEYILSDYNQKLETSSRKQINALNDISFSVKEGEVWGILGLNGAGKSTLLKIISRVTTPTSGEIRIKGKISSLLEVGTGFHPELSGRDNVFLNGVILGMNRYEINKKLDAIVDFAGVSEFIDTPVKRYSSGMIVRLGFSVAAHLDPDIMIIDEVLAVGDQDFQRKSLEKIKQNSLDGKTVIIVSHNLSQISYLTQKCVWLDKGSIKEIGNTDHLLENYKRAYSKYTETFNTTQRRGVGQIKFKNVFFNDYSTVTSGQKLTISLIIDSEIETSTRIALRIDRGFDKIIHLDSFLKRQSIVIKKGLNRIDFVVPRLILIPDRYNLTVFCENQTGIQDWITNAISLNVSDGDFFGTGLNPSKEQAMILQDFSIVDKHE